MGSEWFFSSWFMYRNSELPREPDWLRDDEDSVQLRADETANGHRPERPKGRTER